MPMLVESRHLCHKAYAGLTVLATSSVALGLGLQDIPAGCRVRSVRIAGGERCVHLLEAQSTRAHMDAYTRGGGEDPFGLICWPGAQVLSGQLAALADARGGSLSGIRVVEVGCGTGLCSLTAAALGADVVATDINAEALGLLSIAARAQGLPVGTRQWSLSQSWPSDIFTSKAERVLVCAADVLYDTTLAADLALRMAEAQAAGAEGLVADCIDLYRDVFVDSLRAHATSIGLSHTNHVLSNWSAPALMSHEGEEKTWDAQVEVIRMHSW